MFFKGDNQNFSLIKREKVIPLLPLRDIIVFPHMVVPLFVGRPQSILAIEEVMKGNKEIFVATQKDAKIEHPTSQDIFLFGTVSTVIQILRLPDKTVKILIEGKKRAKIKKFISSQRIFMVQIEELEEVHTSSIQAQALIRVVQSGFEVYIKLNKKIPSEMSTNIQNISDPGRLADAIAPYLTSVKLEERQKVLEIIEPCKRLEKLYELLLGEIEILQVEKKIRTRVKKQMEKTQKEYYLNEQMQAIQKELGEKDEFKNEIQELENRLKNKKMSKEAVLKVQREIKKLKMMAPLSAEATVTRNYIDWILSLPWSKTTEEERDLKKAEQILEEDHYGLKKVKERILEYLAVHALVKKLKGPILCFIGPPGVGKTSLGKSIARATGRKFIRISLGGVRDEAEIRGHRRTYIGSLPGKIIQGIKKAGVSNPVFLLDEIDKMSSDYRGDPASALLEVLDPEQNHMFNDHYIDLDYDLSKVLFITTGNNQHQIPPALQDRMEIITLSGYTEFEKLNIAIRYLVPKQKEACGLKDIDLEITESAIRTIIHYYTKEAGVRQLEREIASVCRKVARQVVTDEIKGKIKITSRLIPQYLGSPKFKYGKVEEKNEIGLANGLAVTTYGGDLLTTEVTVMPGKGKLIITGKLGDVMQESAQAAMSYVRSRAEKLGLDKDFYQRFDIHIHCPEGAIPKDGPSAGITMVTALVSALIKVPVRRDVAMTGEITLRGRVLEIGGLKEKLLAAHRSLMRTVIIPKDNRKDLREIPKRVVKNMQLVLVTHMDEVLREALALEDPKQLFKESDSQPEYLGLEYPKEQALITQ